ncbi:MAG: YkgJ family cysteine cluster protein [Lachnospiraceae bacterium]|nr:YkgJ family cysteine cluster protein [Lachnospiraceae bacterium]
MVPVGCADCEGCSECCRSTADTIILDPQDMYLLSKGTGKVFTDMIEREIEIRLVDGLILPNLMEEHEGEEEHCLFLTDRGRCSIHAFRPGLCRLYPMGRYYTEGGFRYILQKNECTGRVKTDVRLSDWLG